MDSSRCESLIVVDSVSLRIASCAKLSFVFDDLSTAILLNLESPHISYNVGPVRALDQRPSFNKNMRVIFFLNGDFPLSGLVAVECFLEAGRFVGNGDERY